jgi:Lipid A 3-O-deacylase (PagL)
VLYILLTYISFIYSPSGPPVDTINHPSTQELKLNAFTHHGYLFPHHKSMTYFTNDDINAFEFSVSRSYQEYNPSHPPDLGLGLYRSNLGNDQVYGKATAAFFNISSEYLKNRCCFYFGTSTSFGISYISKHFDIDENYSNRAIGSHLNAFFVFSFDLKADIGDQWTLSAGPSIVHMSNGNLKQPNYGLNLINARFGLGYRFNVANIEAHPLTYPQLTEDPFQKNRYSIVFSGGERQISRQLPENHLVSSLVLDYSRRITYNQALGIGIDFVYDPTEGREVYVVGARIDPIVPWHGGIHLSWERIFGPLSIILQPGYKIITPSEHYYYQFNRVGIRYHLKNGLVLNYSIKAHKFAADFFEFGLGWMWGK